ncbi:MAG: hypothetical protein IPP07_21715 [Holophagales bacterium]|nr:hypothetical protein [Holophagales bacterium]
MLFRRQPTDRDIFETVLGRFVVAGNSRRPLEKHPDPDYQVLYGFDVTPCCIPLASVAWLNTKTPGLFLRTTIGHAKDRRAAERAAALITAINYPLPAGAFALNVADGEVLFKNALYFGSASLNEPLVSGLLEPSFEFVSMYWQDVLEAILGSEGPAHSHPLSAPPGAA